MLKGLISIASFNNMEFLFKLYAIQDLYSNSYDMLIDTLLNSIYKHMGSPQNIALKAIGSMNAFREVNLMINGLKSLIIKPFK